MLASDLAGGSFPPKWRNCLGAWGGWAGQFHEGVQIFGQPTHHTLKPKMHGLKISTWDNITSTKDITWYTSICASPSQVAMLIFKTSNDNVTQTSKPRQEIWFCICLFGRTSYYGEDYGERLLTTTCYRTGLG